MTTKKKATSVKFDNELAEQIKQRCQKVGCSQSDFIKNAVKTVIEGESNFNFGDGEENRNYLTTENDLEQKSRVEAIVKKISYDDGKTWIDIPEVQNVRIVD